MWNLVSTFKYALRPLRKRARANKTNHPSNKKTLSSEVSNKSQCILKLIEARHRSKKEFETAKQMRRFAHKTKSWVGLTHLWTGGGARRSRCTDIVWSAVGVIVASNRTSCVSYSGRWIQTIQVNFLLFAAIKKTFSFWMFELKCEDGNKCRK